MQVTERIHRGNATTGKITMRSWMLCSQRSSYPKGAEAPSGSFRFVPLVRADRRAVTSRVPSDRNGHGATARRLLGAFTLRHFLTSLRLVSKVGDSMPIGTLWMGTQITHPSAPR